MERYDEFVLDLWGVVHDGVTVFRALSTHSNGSETHPEIGLSINHEASRNRHARSMGLALPRLHGVMYPANDLAAPARQASEWYEARIKRGSVV